MKIKFCKKCITTNTRPQIIFDKNGICSACRYHDIFFNQGWEKKRKEFETIVKKIKKNSKGYDILIPVSGGKDSTWQVAMCLKYKMNPLTFSYRPLLRTNIGKKNLRNLIELGVDHIDYSINKKVETYFLKRSFYKFGAVGIPMHMAMWGIASYLAKSYKIKYILWGENSAHEYSGTKSNLKLNYLNEKWIKKFGINFNTTIKDWYDKFLNQKNTIPFKRINNSNIKSIFLGDFFKWDPDQILRISQKLGFQSSKQAKTGIYNYADLDDDLISVHHFLKVYKYGFTRTFDNLSIEIRKGRIDRKKAIKIARKSINKIPHNDIRKFCKLIKISKTEFFKVCEKFRNKKIWSKKNKKWELKYPVI